MRIHSVRVRVRARVLQKRKISTSSLSLLSLSLSRSLLISHSRRDAACFFFVSTLVQKSRGVCGRKSSLGFQLLIILHARDRAHSYLTLRAAIYVGTEKKRINDGEEDILRDGLER